MRNFIIKKIRTIYDDFIRSIKDAGQLCDLKSFTYEGDNVPDYKLPIIQQYYLLRYLPAYFAEYYCIYDQMLDYGFLEENLNVLSVGSGCGIDYWSLYFAIKKYSKDPHTHIRYTGVDIVKWLYADSFEINSHWILCQDITLWDKLDEDGYNVVIFPKSIGEFSTNTFNKIKDIFESTPFACDKLCLICSLREKSIKPDCNRFASIAQIMIDNHGYSCLDNLNEYCEQKEDTGINKVSNCNWFKYPDEVLVSMIDVNTLCPIFIKNNNESCEDDCDRINRSPILRTGHMKWQTLRFERI